MNNNYIVVVDFESGSTNPHKTQPVQLAAIVVDPRTLTVGESFNSLICPIEDVAQCEALGLDPLEDQALAKNGHKIEVLRDAPHIDAVILQFSLFLGAYNQTNNVWNLPVMCGYNIENFDKIVLDRYCRKNFWDSERSTNKLFHPYFRYDLMQEMWTWFENVNELDSISFDNIRKYFGMSSDGAHNALVDVTQTAKLMTRILKFKRSLFNRAKFKGSFA